MTVADQLAFQHAQAERREAVERHNYAGVALTLAQIRERLAEVRSQYEPVNTLLSQHSTEKDKALAVARYVVTGRKD